MYIPYSTIPCHTTMPYHAYPNIPQYHAMHTPPYIYTIPGPLAISPVQYSLCPITYIKYSQSTIPFLKVAKEWSRDAVALLPADSEGQHVCSDIGFCCTSGTHRAPASARLVRECLLKDGFSVTQVRHLSEATWKDRNRCSWCYQCALSNPDKQALFNTAYAKWCELA